MNPTFPPAKGLIEIRKYSNRRYYDASHSRHLTIEEIRDRIREGYDIRVTENQTSADITSKVLAQVILDLDAPKFDLFPAGLLTQLIRVNDQLLKGFFETFFRQAVQAFLDYQGLMESRVKQGAMLPALFPPLHAWTQAVLDPFRPEAAVTRSPVAPAGSAPDGDLAASLASLQRQVEELRAQLPGSGRSPRRAAGSRLRR